MDRYSPEMRSALMAKIGGKNTKPELIVRRTAHALGYRFRLHRKDLPGRPDLVFPKYRVTLFVHGCFWHRHHGCKKSTTPATRTAFWEAKFKANLKRDKRVQRDLEALGWRVEIIWECETKKPSELMNRIFSILKTNSVTGVAAIRTRPSRRGRDAL